MNRHPPLAVHAQEDTNSDENVQAAAQYSLPLRPVAQYQAASPARPLNTNLRANPKPLYRHLECFYWNRDGFCIFPENRCLYAHHHTGQVARAHPTQRAEGVKHLECFWWRRTGYCKYTEQQCLYAHHYTGRVAEAPIQKQGFEYPAVAGLNALQHHPTYTDWRGDLKHSEDPPAGAQPVLQPKNIQDQIDEITAKANARKINPEDSPEQMPRGGAPPSSHSDMSDYSPKQTLRREPAPSSHSDISSYSTTQMSNAEAAPGHRHSHSNKENFDMTTQHPQPQPLADRPLPTGDEAYMQACHRTIEIFCNVMNSTSHLRNITRAVLHRESEKLLFLARELHTGHEEAPPPVTAILESVTSLMEVLDRHNKAADEMDRVQDHLQEVTEGTELNLFSGREDRA